MATSKKSSTSSQESSSEEKSTTTLASSSQEALDARITDRNSNEFNPDEILEQEIRDAKPELDFSKIKFIHSSLADHIITLADRMIKKMETELGSEPSKSEFKGVKDMFDYSFTIKDKNNPNGKILNHEEDLKNFIPILTKRIEQGEGARVDGLLKAENIFEQGSHKNRNKFYLSTIAVSSGIEIVKVNWEFAVQTYKEAKEIAEDTFKKAIYDAYVEEYNKIDGNRSNSITAIILRHENSFGYASKITQAIDAYGKSLQKINDDLTTAFNKLSTDLVKSWNLMAQAQTTLMLENKTDSLNLWKSIKSAYNNLISK
ncbi:hypothetical protein [Lewinella sp. LCG006]|uniref:hypothetical protein n=1 Tax=Lewinella sp. LCG006 TaxID=3231911 RepID=UPI00345F207C